MESTVSLVESASSDALFCEMSPEARQADK